jgi:hypothetical protein
VLQVLAVLRRRIGAAPATMWRGRWSRRSSERRGARWCGDLRRGSAPFYSERWWPRGRLRSSMATSLQGRHGSGDDAGRLAMSLRARRA